jgi:hypothetical protein
MFVDRERLLVVAVVPKTTHHRHGCRQNDVTATLRQASLLSGVVPIVGLCRPLELSVASRGL